MSRTKLPTANVIEGAPAMYTDADGDIVTVTLKGAGMAEIRRLGANSDAAQIIVTGGDEKTTLLIEVSGPNGSTTIYDLHITDSLGRLIAPKMDVIGDVEAQGFFSLMVVDAFVGAEPLTCPHD